MTGVEMLKLAGKAAGKDHLQWRDDWYTDDGNICGFYDYTTGYVWNSLVNNADAFEIACKFKLSLSITHSGTSVGKYPKDPSSVFEITSGSEQRHGDSCVATRIAITKYVAEIANSMP